MKTLINKSMDRNDLLSSEATKIISDLNGLIEDLYSRNMYMTSWYGTLPEKEFRLLRSDKRYMDLLKVYVYRVINKKYQFSVGESNRFEYQSLPGAPDDGRIPWFLYWEIFWVLYNTEQLIRAGSRVLDAGGTSSLFSCYLASLGFEVHSIDLNSELIRNANKIASTMGWNLQSYAMDMRKLNFPDGFFDAVYSICVFEHLDFPVKQSALCEIARCLKSKGILALTFDYRNPAPGVVGIGKDTREINRLSTVEDIRRSFISTGHFEVIGNPVFFDNRKSYLIHTKYSNEPYTFGALFLRKK